VLTLATIKKIVTDPQHCLLNPDDGGWVLSHIGAWCGADITCLLLNPDDGGWILPHIGVRCGAECAEALGPEADPLPTARLPQILPTKLGLVQAGLKRKENHKKSGLWILIDSIFFWIRIQHFS
jgi:hypothetical protein